MQPYSRDVLVMEGWIIFENNIEKMMYFVGVPKL